MSDWFCGRMESLRLYLTILFRNDCSGILFLFFVHHINGETTGVAFFFEVKIFVVFFAVLVRRFVVSAFASSL